MTQPPQHFDILGRDVYRRASAGDIQAQRETLLTLLVPHSLGASIHPQNVVQAEFWARAAAAHGDAQDILRLMHVLGMKDAMVCAGTLHGDLLRIRGEVQALCALGLSAAGDDAGLRGLFERTLAALIADACPAILSEARSALVDGGHPVAVFEEMVAANPPSIAQPQPLPEMSAEAERRRACLQTLIQTLSSRHGVAGDVAHMLITQHHEFSPDLLDSVEGCDSILSAVAGHLGEPPAVSITLH